MLVTGTEACIQEFETGLIAKFGQDGVSSFIGDEIDFLGMRVSRNPRNNDITLTQTGYIESIYEEENLQTDKKQFTIGNSVLHTTVTSRQTTPKTAPLPLIRRTISGER